MARQLFRSVVVKNKTAVAVAPRPDLRPYFRLIDVNLDEKECIGESDGGRIRIFRPLGVRGARHRPGFPATA